MNTDTLNPPLNDPFREEPEPDLSDALPCVCGDRPDWDKNLWGDFRLFCYRHDVDGPWKGDLDSAIASWNLKVIEAGDCEGDNRKAAGIEQVAEHNKAWLDEAVDCIRALALTHETFTSENLRHICRPPNHPNAWGAAMNTAARQGLIERVGYSKNKLPSAHARVVAQWRGKS